MGVKKAQKPALSSKHQKTGVSPLCVKRNQQKILPKKQKKTESKPKTRTKGKSGEKVSARVGSNTVSNLQKKISIILQSSDNELKVPIRDNTRQQSTAEPVVLTDDVVNLQHIDPEVSKTGHTEIAETVRVPYRFSPLAEQKLARAAQVVGAIFLTLGCSFSFTTIQGSHISGLNVLNLNTATIATSNDSTQAFTTSVAVDPKPETRVIVDAGDILRGIVPVTVTVPYALEVRLNVERKSDGRVLFLGTMNRIDDTTWKFAWHTTEVLDGEYRFRVVVKNEFGIYDQAHSETYYVENTTSATQNQTATGEVVTQQTAATSSSVIDSGQTESVSTAGETITTATASTTSTQSTALQIQVLEDLPLAGGALFRINAPSANEVKVYARSTYTGILHYIGLAVNKSESTWEIEWKTKTVPNGTYTVFAKTSINGTTQQTPPLSVSIKNETLTSTQIESSTSTEVATKAPSTIVVLKQTGDVSKSTDVQVLVDSPVQWVELYALLKNSLTPYFLGLARKVSETEWRYIWETTQTPNGEYQIYARVRSSYGFSESARVQTVVKNLIYTSYSEEEEKAIDTYKDIEKNLIDEADDVETVLANATGTTRKVTYIEPTKAFLETVHEEGETKNYVSNSLEAYRFKLDQKILELSEAIRSGDTAAVQQVKSEIEAMKQQLITELASEIDKKELLDSINSYVSKISFELQELTENNEKIIKERVGDAITSDTDQDGISDYDEINLYSSNPFAADTDGDSYIDSTEVTLGFNVLDSTNKNQVTYESPKETGIVRSDLLYVESVTTLSVDVTHSESTDTPPKPRAIISGKGLPNSFVTLYIFSSPVIVTVRTDSTGNWSYIFDKEIEDGSHEVYIGITDNNGKIIAKSNPLPFVKTAEAFSDGTAINDQTVIEESTPALVGNRLVLILASIIVLLFGGVLLYLGFHASRHKEESDISPLALGSIMPGHHD